MTQNSNPVLLPKRTPVTSTQHAQIIARRAQALWASWGVGAAVAEHKFNKLLPKPRNVGASEV